MGSETRHPQEPAGPSLDDYRSCGFPMGGEPLAVDLADTVVTVTDPATDLLTDPDRVEVFWRLQAPRLPAGWSAPTADETRELRDHVRHVLVATMQSTAPRHESLAVLAAASAAAPTSIDFTTGPDPAGAGPRWHGSGAALARAATARSLHEVLSGPWADRLRECANPACSMLFVATDGRRKWCSSTTCGNRTRVARHYQRTRSTAAEPGGRRRS